MKRTILALMLLNVLGGRTPRRVNLIPQAPKTSQESQVPSAPARSKDRADTNRRPWDWHEAIAPEYLSNWILALVGLLGTIAALLTLLSMKLQIGEMEKQRRVMKGQLDTMRDQLELEHRPWIAVDVKPGSPITFDERGCVLVCKVTMTNVGHSVAKHVSLWTDFALLGIDDPIKIRDHLCDIMRQPQNESSDYGWLLFPGQSAMEQRPIIATTERLKEAWAAKTFQGMNAVGLHLVGCVDYPSPLDPKRRHQTRFVYVVSFVDAANGRVIGAFDPTSKTYNSIVLMPTMHGASAD